MSKRAIPRKFVAAVTSGGLDTDETLYAINSERKFKNVLNKYGFKS